MAIVVGLGAMILPVIATTTYAVVQELRGHHAIFAECITVGTSRLLLTLGTVLLYTLILLVGFCLCIIPGIVFQTVYWVVVPIAVLEGISGPPLGRSKELTEGNRLTIFGIIFIIGVFG